MILQMCILLLALAMPLTAAQENMKGTDFQNHTSLKYQNDSLFLGNNLECCKGGCNDCRESPSGAQLLQFVQAALTKGIFSLPQIKPLVVQQILLPNLTNSLVVQELAQIIVENGIGGPTGPT